MYMTTALAGLSTGHWWPQTRPDRSDWQTWPLISWGWSCCSCAKS